LVLAESYGAGTLDFGAGTLDLYREFWSTLTKQSQLPFVDLVPLFKTFTPTYYPLAEEGSYHHYTANGCLFYAYAMAWMLEHEHLIPVK